MALKKVAGAGIAMAAAIYVGCGSSGGAGEPFGGPDASTGASASLGSPGSDEIRWLKPVRPGDTLRARFTILEAIPSRSKPDRGVVKTFTEMLNQHGEVVMTMRGLGMFGRRPV